MPLFDWVQILVFLILLVALAPLLGMYLARVFQGEPTTLSRAFSSFEKLSYRACRIDENEEMDWRKYAKALLLFNFIGFCALFIILILQAYLPLNPQNFGSVSWHLALNTAMSFATNTNWQAYPGETTLSNFSQMVGLTVQNFTSAASGMAALMALIRGIKRKSMETIGNFWVDMMRAIIYLLLPLSIILSLILVSQGVVQTLSPFVEVTTLENETLKIPLGPVASQVAIKQIGTNGGGFFNANSAHPFENPTALTNLLELLSLILIPASLTFTYGSIMNSKKHGWLLFFAMFLIWGAGLGLALYAEYTPNPILNVASNLEGKRRALALLTQYYGLRPRQPQQMVLSMPCIRVSCRSPGVSHYLILCSES